MSLGIYPVFKTKQTSKFYCLGEGLARNFEVLDQIAVTAKLIPIMTFADNREVPIGFEGDPDELAEIMGEWNDWFDSGVGRSAIRLFVDHIKNNPEAAQQINDLEWIVEELEELEMVLEVAEKKNIQFRLEMS